MGGVHLLIGVGEGLITAVTVSTVLAIRPDLVYGARELVAPLVLRGADGDVTVTPETPGSSSAPVAARRPGWFLPAGIAVAALLAGVVSFYASSSPDGLESVAEDKGFSDQATDTRWASSRSPTTGDVGGIPVGVAGVIGVGVTLAVGGGVFYAVRRREDGGGTGSDDSDKKVSV